MRSDTYLQTSGTSVIKRLTYASSLSHCPPPSRTSTNLPFIETSIQSLENFNVFFAPLFFLREVWCGDESAI
jgi:hypothetical protein